VKFEIVKYHLENLYLIKGDENQHFGAIYSGMDWSNNQKVILKKVAKTNLKGIEAVYREFSFQLNTSFFPEIIDLIENENEILLLSKFKEGERLDTFWKSIKKKDQISTLKQIVTALGPLMGYLEKERIAHCDIKPSNILVQKKENHLELALIDFGLGMPHYFQGERKLRFPLGYAAPELILNHLDLVNQKTDVYAIGVMIWRLLSDKMPLHHPNPSIYTNLQLNLELPDNDNISKQLLQILNKASKKHNFRIPPNLMKVEDVKQNLENAINERSSFQILHADILELPERKRWFF
jgi:serine/threonine protein kinase